MRQVTMLKKREVGGKVYEVGTTVSVGSKLHARWVEEGAARYVAPAAPDEDSPSAPPATRRSRRPSRRQNTDAASSQEPQVPASSDESGEPIDADLAD